jgi:hypothetical protein
MALRSTITFAQCLERKRYCPAADMSHLLSLAQRPKLVSFWQNREQMGVTAFEKRDASWYKNTFHAGLA